MGKYKSLKSRHEVIYEHIGTSNDLIIHSLAGVTNPDPKYEIIRNHSDCYSIEYILEGEGVIQEGDKIYKVSKGDIFIMHPGYYHHYYSSPKDPWKKIWIYITNYSNYMASLLKLYGIENQTVFEHSDLCSIFNKIFDLHKNNPSNFSSMLELTLHELIINLSQVAKETHTTKTLFEQAKYYIDQNITTRITVKEVSKYININSSYLSQGFKKAFGISPVQYIIQQKMLLAGHLLGTTTLSVPEISNHLCFCDLAHFSHSFFKYYNMTPTQYRQKISSDISKKLEQA